MAHANHETSFWQDKSNDGRFEGADGETSCCLHYSRVQRLDIRHAANTCAVAAHFVQLISYHKDLRFGIRRNCASVLAD